MNKHFGRVVATTNKLTAIACETCGYAHLDLLPTQPQLDHLYANEYYQTHNAGWFEKEAREQWCWFAVYNQRLTYAEQLFVQAEIRRLVQKKRMMRIYDYGAGCGWFVKLAEDYGNWAFGYEPSPVARKYANEVLHTYLFDEDIMTVASVQGEYKAWDFIHASMILEHLLDPASFLQQAYTSLKSGGILCIVVPNEFNPLQRRLERYGYTPLHAHHLNYFTPRSLKALCEKAGFEVVRHTSTLPIEWFALHGLNFVKYPRLGIVVHLLRMLLIWTALTFAPERWERKRDEWAAQGIGREIELWLRKV